jgi:hypothetical protein
MAKVVWEMAFGKGRKRAAKVHGGHRRHSRGVLAVRVVNRPPKAPARVCPLPGCSKRSGHDLGTHDVQMHNARLSATRTTKETWW